MQIYQLNKHVIEPHIRNNLLVSGTRSSQTAQAIRYLQAKNGRRPTEAEIAVFFKHKYQRNRK